MAETVTVNFDLEEIAEQWQDALQQAMESGVQFAEQELKKRIPANRVKTRRAVFSLMEDLTGEVGLLFPAGTRYAKRGTETERIFNRAWQDIKQSVLDHIEQTFYELIEE